MTEEQKKLIAKTNADAQRLSANIKKLIPMAMSDYEKKLDKDGIELFKKAVEATGFNNLGNKISDAEIDYNKFMKEHASNFK